MLCPIGEPEEHPDRSDLATAEAVHEVARKRVLARRADHAFALVADGHDRRSELPLGTVRVVDRPPAGRDQIARPADLTIRVTDIASAVCVEHADQPGPAARPAPPGHLEIDHVADSGPSPERAHNRIDEGENPVLELERGVPEMRHETSIGRAER